MPEDGMSKTEVEEHLKDLKTDKGKIGYLNSVLNTDKKHNYHLLAKGTRKVIYETLGELHENERDFHEAKIEYRAAGENKKAEQMSCLEEADILISEALKIKFSPNKWEKAAKLREKAGDFVGAADSYKGAAENHSNPKKQAICYKEAARLSKKAGREFDYEKFSKKAVKHFEKDSTPDSLSSAGELLEQLDFPDQARQDYEKAADELEEEGKGVKARRIRRKISRLRSKGSLESKLPAVLLIGILGIGLYFLFSNINITSNAVMNLGITNQGFLINFILLGILGLVCYSYMK